MSLTTQRIQLGSGRCRIWLTSFAILFLSLANEAWPKRKIRRSISGTEAKAISVALEHFEQKLEEKRAQNRSAIVEKYASNVSNYDVRLESEEKAFIIKFSLKVYPGVLVAGLEGRYEIGEDFQIKKVKFTK